MTTSTTTITTTINHFINEAETAGEGGRTQPVYNPATGAVSADLRLANRADLDATVAAARAGADSWGDITPGKVVTSRWPEPTHASGASYNFPSN
jgi:malonate-semialdehyde dehydrogenase (acetylating)/methylmalonate-semialdehyde dehydrogenase